MLGKRRKTREICAFCHGFHVNAKDLCDFWAMKPSLQGECQGRSAHLSRVSCTVHPVNSYPEYSLPDLVQPAIVVPAEIEIANSMGSLIVCEPVFPVRFRRQRAHET